MPSEPNLVGTPRKRHWRWLVSIAVGIVSGAVGYAAAYGLGCTLTCTVGRSPLAFGLLIAVTTTIAALRGMSGHSSR